MLLTIHGLPYSTKYQDLKLLIKDKCNITDFILDNLVSEGSNEKKVRIGLTDDGDGKLLIKCLDGTRLGGSLLRVVPVSKNQPPSEPAPFERQRNPIDTFNPPAQYGNNIQATEPEPWRSNNQWQADARPSIPYHDNFNSQHKPYAGTQAQLATPRVEIPQLNLAPREMFPRGAVPNQDRYKPQPPAVHPTRTAALREIKTVDTPPPQAVYQETLNQFPNKSMTIKKDNFQGPQSTRNLRLIQPEPQQKPNIIPWSQTQEQYPVRDSRGLMDRSGRYSPSELSMNDRRQSPHRQNDGRRPSPGRRTSPARKNSPPRRNLDRVPERYSPTRRVVDDVVARSRFDQSAPNQAMYGDEFRSNLHENVQYPVPGARVGPWQQFAGNSDERRPKFESRAFSPRKSRSPVRRERSPLKDRVKRHSPSPRSPRRSWALEKRRSPEISEAPPPPSWPGAKEDPFAANKSQKDKYPVMWDRNKYDDIRSPESDSMRNNRPAMPRPISPPRRQMYKPEESRFDPSLQKPPQKAPRMEEDRRDLSYRQLNPMRGDAGFRPERPEVRDLHRDRQDFRQPKPIDQRDEDIQNSVGAIKRRETQQPRYDIPSKPLRVTETLDKEIEDIYKRTTEFKKKAEQFRHAEDRRKEEERRKDIEFKESLRHDIEREPPRDRHDFRREEHRGDRRRLLDDSETRKRSMPRNDRDLHEPMDRHRNPQFENMEVSRSERHEIIKRKSIEHRDDRRDQRDEKREDRRDVRIERHEDRRDVRIERNEDRRDLRFERSEDRRNERREDHRFVKHEEDRREERRDERDIRRDDRRDTRRVDRNDDHRDSRIDEQRKQIQTLLREKACSELAERILDRREDKSWNSDQRLRVKEELRHALMNILNDMFKDKDASFIEYTVKFRAYYDARQQNKLFEDIVEKVVPPGHAKSADFKDPQQQSIRCDVKGADWDIAPANENTLIQTEVMQPLINQFATEYMQNVIQPNFVPIMGLPHVETIPQFMIPTEQEEINLYLCKDNFDCFTELQLEYLRKFLFCEIEKASQISHGWSPDFSFKPMHNLHRYELKTYDVRTKDWIMNIDFTKFNYFNVLVYTKEELWYERAAVWLPGHSRCKMDPLNKLKLQNRQLEDVNIDKWKLVKKIVTDKGTRIYVDMPPAAARALEKHKMVLSYELQKVNVFLKAIAVDKEVFDQGLRQNSLVDQQIIINAAQNCNIPILPNDPQLVKIFIKGNKSLTVTLARQIKEMLIYQIYKYHQQQGRLKTDFLKFGICMPNFFAVLPENNESRKFVMNLSLGSLKGAAVVVAEKDAESGIFFKMDFKFPFSVDGVNKNLLTKRLRISNLGVKGLNIDLWKYVDKRNTFTLVFDVDLESIETIIKLKYQLEFSDFKRNEDIVYVYPQCGKRIIEEEIKKYKAEKADTYEESNMDISQSDDENDDDVICLD